MPDPTFGSQGIVTTQSQVNYVADIAVQPDGKIVEAGGQSSTAFAIVRYNTDGTLDTTFGSQGIVSGSAGESLDTISISPDGIIVAGGSAGSDVGPAVFEFNSNGTPNMSFGNQGVLVAAGGSASDGSVSLIQADGKFYVSNTQGVQRFNADGSVDASFHQFTPTPPIEGGRILEQTPDGKLLMTATVDIQHSALFRLNADGTPDASFGTNGEVELATAYIGSLAVQADNRVIVGSTQSGGLGNVFQVQRLNVNGSLDATFGGLNDDGPNGPSLNGGGLGTDYTFVGSTNALLSTLLVQPDGRVIAVGSFSPPANEHGGSPVPNGLGLVRYNPDGTLDTTFGTAGIETLTIPGTLDSQTPIAVASTATLQVDGKILVGGSWAVDTMTTMASDSLTVRFLGDTPSGTPHQQFVSQAYLDLLQRPVDQAGLTYWSGLLDSGQLTAQQVGAGIEQSQEYHSLIVNQLHGEYLQRAADAFGLSSWDNFLAAGGTEDQLRAALLGSAEYYALSGSSAVGFVSMLCHDILQRSADPVGAQSWINAIAGGASLSAVAGSIIRSVEGNALEVADLYFWLLHRAPDSGGLQIYTQDLAQGVTAEAIVAAMVGSPEYVATRV